MIGWDSHSLKWGHQYLNQMLWTMVTEWFSEKRSGARTLQSNRLRKFGDGIMQTMQRQFDRLKKSTAVSLPNQHAEQGKPPPRKWWQISKKTVRAWYSARPPSKAYGPAATSWAHPMPLAVHFIVTTHSTTEWVNTHFPSHKKQDTNESDAMCRATEEDCWTSRYES